MKEIHITSGDEDGIGLEISLKALLSLKPKKNYRFFLWRSRRQSFLEPELKDVRARFFSKKQTKALGGSKLDPKIQLVEVLREDPPPQWVKAAVKLCLSCPRRTALVTAPLSKTAFQKAGLLFKGHTDMFKSLSGKTSLFMCFMGKEFNVVLLTDHEPLSQVKITKKRLTAGLDEAIKFRSKLLELKKNLIKKKIPAINKPIGVLGFNPHAGESGILGKEESLIFKPVLEKYKSQNVFGPLAPDAAFSFHAGQKYSFYICAYHDQGLIPFKMKHTGGAHITLGLPFVRTSVVHGTAKDIFSKNKASAESMKTAVQWAELLLENS